MLVVEDESLIAMLIEDMLENLGCVVAASAGSIPEAFEKVREGGFDFALLDVNVAGKPVFSIAEALSEQCIPFAFASGYGSVGMPEEFCTTPVVPKPFRKEELAIALSTALASKGPRC